MRAPGGRPGNMKWGPQGAFGCPISRPDRPLMIIFRFLEVWKKLMQKCNILDGLAFWNLIFRPRRASKTKQIFREYYIFAYIKARLYRKTQYDRENHKKIAKLVQKQEQESLYKN